MSPAAEGALRPTPPRVPASLFTTCGYFLPRLLFLQSRHAPQVHWGDIAEALQGFPEDTLDLGSAAFWDEWCRRWAALGDRYVGVAQASSTPAGSARAHRSAAACYHWAEFMYFDDAQRKTKLRRNVRTSFEHSLEGGDLALSRGEVKVELADGPYRAPYWLVLPPAHRRGAGPLPCMILSNGLDSITEVEVLALAESYLERGIATLLFEGPGQGLSIGQKPLLIEMEGVVAALVEQLRNDLRIDGGRLGFLGVSFGGYFALRVAQQLGNKFRCIVNLSGGPRIAPYSGLPRRLKDDFRFAFGGGDNTDMQARFDALALDVRQPALAPVLSVHGALDDIFPLRELEALDRAWPDRHELSVQTSEAHVCLNQINTCSLQAADWAAQRLFAH